MNLNAGLIPRPHDDAAIRVAEGEERAGTRVERAVESRFERRGAGCRCDRQKCNASKEMSFHIRSIRRIAAEVA